MPESSDVTWISKDDKQFLPAWITAGTFREQGREGRYWMNLLSTYCKKPIDDSTNLPLVAKRGGLGTDFAVYIGLPKSDLLRNDINNFYRRLTTIPGTIEHGWKVGEELARYFFPRLTNYHYRL